MKTRIAMWASAGFLVAACWALYFAMRSKDNPIEPLVYALGSSRTQQSISAFNRAASSGNSDCIFTPYIFAGKDF